ncbi:MAG: hypothetical protein GY719_02330 [bacterium]|nr:hypothetical protein [bacterium]
MSTLRMRVAAAIAGGLLAAHGVSDAVEVHGSARVYGGATESDEVEVDQLDQRYTLNLLQALTPWLSLGFSYRVVELETTTDGGQDFERSSRDPLLELVYRRPRLDGRLSFRDRRNRGTNPSDNLDLQALVGQLRWRPIKGPSYALQLRDETNVADAALFGRDVSSRFLGFESIYDRQLWGARYAYQTTSIDNQTTGFRLDEDRHQLRGHYAQQFWEDKLALTMSSWISRREQTEVSSAGARPATPITAREGLFALDTTPEIGELDPAPDLVDGDTETPAAPEIEIGGANTFRNIGVDLGLGRRVTRLEITVDAPSAPDLFWEVYHSSDNLSWVRVAGVDSAFDGALSRYTLFFPETTDRYFKAVNVTINTFARVAVTEVRALAEVDRLTSQEGRSTTYRADLNASYSPHERVDATFTFGIGNDEDLAGGLLSRDLDELSYGARVEVGITPKLDLRVGYRFNSVDERLEPALQRDEELWSATFDWSPLATASGLLTFSRRDEKEGNLLIRSADTVRLRLLTELFADLELVSEVTWSDVDDPFGGFTQKVWQFRESVRADLTRDWSLQGSISQSYFDSTGTVVIERRTSADLRTFWRATPYLSFSGDWDWSDDDLQRTLTQRYGAFYSPGPKLTASLSYQDTESTDIRRTTTVGGGVNYRFRPRLTPFLNFSRSTFRQVGVEPSENLSIRAGFNLFF